MSIAFTSSWVEAAELAPLAVAVVVFYFHHNCPVARCWRVGRIVYEHKCKKHFKQGAPI